MNPIGFLAFALFSPPVLATAAPAVPFAHLQETDLEEWIERGRRAMDAGDLQQARQILEQAAALDKDGEQGLIWLLRLEIAEGKHDSVLGQVSSLRSEGADGLDYEYLLGMAMAAKCANDMAAGGSSSLQFFLEDARNTLAKVTEADPARYRDAHAELSWIAFELSDLDLTERAATAALELNPDQPNQEMQLGRVYLARLAVAYQEQPADLENLKSHADPAELHLGRVIQLIPSDTPDAGLLTLAAQAHGQIATVRAYLSDQDGAALAYTEALVLDPNAVNLGTALSVVENERFTKLLAEASRRFTERHGQRDARDATLQWWLGWALYDTNDPREFDNSEAAFRKALDKYPAFTTAHYYLGLVSFARQEYDDALEHLRTHARLAPEELYSLVGNDGDNLPRLTGLLDHFYQAGRLGEASFMGNLLARGYPTYAPYWNNLGLFLRDHGAMLAAVANRDGDDSEESASEIAQTYEQSYNAYVRALDLEPENPAYLNDTAVILHYYLERDYENALEMYARAAIAAQEQLDSGDVPANEAEIVRIALRDAKNNRALLERKIADEARGEAKQEATGG